MKIIACVYAAGEPGVELVASLHRQIRPPEDVLVAIPNTSNGEDLIKYSRVSLVEATEQAPLVALLTLALNRWRTLSTAERYDTAFLFAHNVEVRKDAVDYLRKTYVPGRVVCFASENPYSIAGQNVTRLDATGVLLVPCRIMEKIDQDWADLSSKLISLPGYKGVGLGWWAASRGVQAGCVGAAIRYARPLEAFDMANVDLAGDHITNFWCAE